MPLPFSKNALTGLLLAMLALGGALVAARTFDQPKVSFALPVEGKGTVTYTCRQTSTLDEARSRAEAAHLAFQADLNAAALALAPQILAAMEKASATGDRKDLEAANEAYKARSKQLRQDLQTRFGCWVDTTLQAKT